MAEKKRVTIELTEKDREHLGAIQEQTGDTTMIAAIRFALRETAQTISEREKSQNDTNLS